MIALTLGAVVVDRPPPDRLVARGDPLRHRRAGRRSASSCPRGGPARQRRPAPSHVGLAVDHPGRAARSLLRPRLGRRLAACSDRRAARPRSARPDRRSPTIPVAPRPNLPAPAPDGWLRPGSVLGLPIVWAAICLGRHPDRRVHRVATCRGPPSATSSSAACPPAHTGPDAARADQVDVRLPQQPARDARRRRRRGGPGRSTSSRSGSTRTASPAARRRAIYDAGNLVIWWLGIPAMVFVAWQAFAPAEPRPRRSSSSASRASGCPGRASTGRRSSTTTTRALPFLLIALAYFLAELWHGPSTPDVAAGPDGGRGRRSSARPLLWLFEAATVRARPGHGRQPGLAGLRRRRPPARSCSPGDRPAWPLVAPRRGRRSSCRSQLLRLGARRTIAGRRRDRRRPLRSA